jgi:hypothetical protein
VGAVRPRKEAASRILTTGVFRRDKEDCVEATHAVHTKHITPERPINAELDQVNFLKKRCLQKQEELT